MTIKSLRALSGYVPQGTELGPAFAALHDMSDHAAAMVGCSLVEATLQRLLVTKMVFREPAFVKTAFGHGGPMSDFASMITVAMAFGFITPAIGDDLNTLRRVRNVFAHAKTDITFDEPALADVVRNLLMTMLARVEKVDISTTKKAYVLNVRMLCFILNCHVVDAGGEPMAEDSAFKRPSNERDGSKPN